MPSDNAPHTPLGVKENPHLTGRLTKYCNAMAVKWAPKLNWRRNTARSGSNVATPRGRPTGAASMPARVLSAGTAAWLTVRRNAASAGAPKSQCQDKTSAATTARPVSTPVPTMSCSKVAARGAVGAAGLA
eukprot:CAMPEP_0117583232 /NCGR_PEP_ID=MMETSP0784-20121206/66894_1 /TAXON_ID=39447 /ORGANISM="" /LENGTH=130 /DNA_ID=CAMNT_0005383883 /DNA_START=329 /DNA_END=722 /DNA_ORIENTATION=-